LSASRPTDGEWLARALRELDAITTRHSLADRRRRALGRFSQARIDRGSPTVNHDEDTPARPEIVTTVAPRKETRT
jgi:hypothetical protein